VYKYYFVILFVGFLISFAKSLLLLLLTEEEKILDVKRILLYNRIERGIYIIIRYVCPLTL